MKKVKIGAVGLGRLGAVHATNIAHKIPNAELVAVCSRTKSTAESFAKKMDVAYAYDSFDQMIENDELDAVCITTYTRFHPEQILKALDKNLAVFCDKPIAENLLSTERTVAEIEKYHSDKICMIGYMKRYDPSYRFVKEQIDKGMLGTPILFRGYAVDAKKISDSTLKYISDSEGIFFDFFVHDFDLSRWLVGSNWKEDTVASLGGIYEFPEFEKYRDFDNAACFAQFENNTMAFYHCGRTAPHGYLIETEIIGTEAIYRIGTTPSKNLVEVLDHRGKIKEEHQIFLDRFEEAYLNEMIEFVDCILEKRQPEITIQDALASCKMAHLASKLVNRKIRIS